MTALPLASVVTGTSPGPGNGRLSESPLSLSVAIGAGDRAGEELDQERGVRHAVQRSLNVSERTVVRHISQYGIFCR